MAATKPKLFWTASLWLMLSLAGWAQTITPPTIEELSKALLAAKTEQQQTALLDRHQELPTAPLLKRLDEAAGALYQKSDFQAALAAFQLARQVAERIGDSKGVIAALNGFGTTHLARGNYQPAWMRSNKL